MTQHDGLLRPATVETRPTLTGRALCFVTVVALLFAWSGLGAVFGAVAALGAATAGVAFFAARFRAGGLRILPPASATAVAREPFVLDVVVVNTALRTAALDVTFALRGPSGMVRDGVLLPRLAAGERRTVPVRGPALRRGRHALGALRVETAAPLGLAVCAAEFPLDGEVLVLPRVGTLRRPDRIAPRTRAVTDQGGAGRGEEHEVHGLRAWREGESLRHVHWKLSARRGRLLVREYRGEPRPPVHVVLATDVDPKRRDAHGAFEDAVSLAATLVEHHLRNEHAVRMTVLGRAAQPVPCGRGRGGLAIALEALADVTSQRGPATSPWERLASGSRGEQTFLVRVGGGSAEAAPASACVLDVTDAATRQVFDPVRRLPGFAARAAEEADRDVNEEARRTGAAVAGDLGALLRRSSWAASALAFAATGAAAWAAATSVRSGAFLTLPNVCAWALAGLAGAHAVHAARAPAGSDVHRRSLWFAPAACVAATFLADASGLGIAAALAAVCLLAGLGAANALDARRAVRDAVVPGGEPGRAGRRRALAGAALAVPALLAAFLLLPLTTRALYVAAGESSLLRGNRPHGGSRGASSGRGGGSVMLDPAAAGGRDPDFLRRALMEVEPRIGDRPAGHQGPLYLRGAVLVSMDRQGRWVEEPPPTRRVDDRSDGRRDGWCTLAPRPAGEDALELRVRAVLLEHGSTGLPVAHAPGDVAAVRAAAVLHEPDGAILLPARADDDGVVEYGVECRRPGRVPAPDAGTPAYTADPAARALPEGVPVVAALAEEARRATEGVEGDLAAVRAVVRHLREGFGYEETSTDGGSADAIEVLLAERRGTCVQFAGAAVLMLRTRGIPARIATGFLAREWNADRKVYVARGRHYHAWFEVEFDGLGWVPFDATPDAGDEDAGFLDDTPLGAGSVSRMVRSMHDALSDVARFLRAHPWIFVLSAFLSPALLLLLRAFFRRVRTEPAVAVPPRDDGMPEGSPWRRLLVHLAQRGHRRAPSQTALEFAAEVVAKEGSTAAAFLELTRRQQQARFGGRPLTADDERAMDALRL